MHSTLQKLADRASFVGDRYALPDEFAEEFSKLIVMECANIVDTYVGMKVDPSLLGNLVLMSFGLDK